MKQLLFIALFSMTTIYTYGQISFEPGYYINNSGQKIECQIKNIDWNSNPTELEYRLSENDAPKTLTMEAVKEFGITNASKYIRNTVNIDRSSSIISEMSYERRPDFNEETLFLKALVEGPANLYGYTDGNLRRYFYSNNGSSIEQLVFKNFKRRESTIGENNMYKNQLWNAVRCPSHNIRVVENLRYFKSNLVKYFVNYNECTNGTSENYEQKQKRDLFNLNIRPGLKLASLLLEDFARPRRSVDFGNELTIRIGLEAEFIMPFNKNKWSLIIEPTYQYFKAEGEAVDQTVTADYRSLEVPIGVRHYFFIDESSKLFVNASYVFDLNVKSSSITYELAGFSGLRKANNFALGVGYKYNDKFSLELRYQTPRDLLSNFGTSDADYKGVSLIFGYSVF